MTTKDLLKEVEQYNTNYYEKNKNLFSNLLLDKSDKLERLNDILKEVDEINDFMEKFKILENLNNAIFDIKEVIEKETKKFTKNDLLLQILEIVENTILVNGLEKLNKDCGCKYDDVKEFYTDDTVELQTENDDDYNFVDDDDDEDYY